jgi:hypothetical protein
MWHIKKPAARVFAMDKSRKDYSLIAWMLYACVLFNLLSCGIAHGQMAGLALNGAGGQFCSISNSGIADFGSDLFNQSKSNWASNFTCPVCSSITLSLAFLFCLAWLVRTRQVQRKPVETRSKAPPRYSWPSANPRASPMF